jgi:hypothetical protein
MVDLALVSILAGIYGAVATTYGVLVSHNQRRRRLLVEVSFAPGSSLALAALNLGQPAVTLQQAGLILPDGRSVLPRPLRSSPRFPVALADGERCVVWLSAREVAGLLLAEGRFATIPLVGFYVDAEGRQYASPPLAFRPSEWLKQQRSTPRW